MISDRQEKILKVIVDLYVKDAKPVGSKLLSKKFKLSSATLRNDMMELENQGLLEKTHTSSGRVPSELGYRYYVDHIMKHKDISKDDMLKLATIFNNRANC